jgi:hypothetical protein
LKKNVEYFAALIALAEIIILLVFSISSCHPSKNLMTNKFDEKAIPKDILKDGYTLLVKIPYNSKVWVRKFTSAMKDHYSGQFELVPYSTSLSESYSNTNKYKYILNISNSTNSFEFSGMNKSASAGTITNPQGNLNSKIIRSHLYIKDRTNSSMVYDSGLEAQDVMTILKFYADKLSGK